MSESAIEQEVEIPDPYSIPLEEINLAQPRLFQQDAHWDYFKRLREEDPVHYCANSEFGPFWSITKFKDIKDVDTNHEVFSSAKGITLGLPLVDRDESREFNVQSFIGMDQPKHDVQRNTVSPVVAPRNLAAMEDEIRKRTVNILESLPVGKTFDWVETVSIELTTQMLAILFDFPFEDRHKLTYWSDVATAVPGAGLINSNQERREVLYECLEYFTKLWNERVNAPPTGDLISMLAHGEDTRDMEPLEFLGNLILLIVGGNDTTRNSMSGSVLALNQNPKEYQKLRDDPKLITNMISEVIRWQTPLAYMRRTAKVDHEVGGKLIKAGDVVLMWFVSGNRDPEAIDRPDDFIIDRAKARQHLSFGFGIHRCMGNRLAEMQLRVLWEEIMKRFSYVEVVGEPERTYSTFVKGYNHLPVKLHAL